MFRTLFHAFVGLLNYGIAAMYFGENKPVIALIWTVAGTLWFVSAAIYFKVWRND